MEAFELFSGQLELPRREMTVALYSLETAHMVMWLHSFCGLLLFTLLSVTWSLVSLHQREHMSTFLTLRRHRCPQGGEKKQAFSRLQDQIITNPVLQSAFTSSSWAYKVKYHTYFNRDNDFCKHPHQGHSGAHLIQKQDKEAATARNYEFINTLMRGPQERRHPNF